jgi:uncharacterized Tic20 family protein
VDHGHVVFNWIVSVIVYGLIGVLLTVVVIGIPILLALGLVSLVFPIIGAVKASDGVVWRYPLSIQVFQPKSQ